MRPRPAARLGPMTDQNALEALRDRPIRSDADVLALVRALLLPVVRRQCWLLFLGEDAVPVQLLVPIDLSLIHI